MLERTFASFVRQTVTNRFDGRSNKLAEAIGVVPSQVSRASAGGRPFGAVTCVRLAMVASASPSYVLHLAGREDDADLFEAVYGPERRPMTQAERMLIALPDRTKAALVRACVGLGAALANQSAARAWSAAIGRPAGRHQRPSPRRRRAKRQRRR